MEHVINWVLARFAENMRVIREAPESFLFFGLIVAGIVWLGIATLHGERFEVLSQRIGSLNEEVMAYKEKLKGASPDQAASQVGELKKTIDSLNKQLSDIKLKQDASAPRALTEDQRRRFIQHLKDSRVSGITVSIEHDGNCLDCNDYSQDFVNLISSIEGWRLLGNGTFFGSGAPSKGLSIKLANKDSAPSKAFLKALDAADIQYNLSPMLPNLPGEIELIIFPKRQ